MDLLCRGMACRPLARPGEESGPARIRFLLTQRPRDGIILDLAGKLAVLGLALFLALPAFADGWDPGDDVPTGATALAPSTVIQSHGLHDLGVLDQADWYSVPMAAGFVYAFDTLGGNGDSFGEIYSDLAGSQLEASDNNGAGSGQFGLTFTAGMSQTYYLKVRTQPTAGLWNGSLRYWVLGEATPTPTPEPLSRFAVYPNPLRGNTLKLNIPLQRDAGNILVEFYDMGFRRVFSKNWGPHSKSGGPLSLEGTSVLRPGYYFVRVRADSFDGGGESFPLVKLVVGP